MKYFYIIKRNGVIYEMHYTQDAYKAAFSEFIKGGILIIKPVGYENPQGTNAKDIVDVVDEVGYETYIRTANPREYVKDGVWYDGKEKRELRAEKWKQIERSTQAQLNAPKEEKPTEEEIARINKRREKVSKFVRNGFKKELKN